MSEERFEQIESKENDEDVEAHRRPRMATDEPTAEGESDDVEAHRRVRMANDDSTDEGSDDVEAHRRKA